MRCRAIAVLIFVPFVAMRAQQVPIVASSNSVAQTFRAFGRPYGAWLLMAFDSIPASKYAFRPTPVQQSIGYIAQHLENANYQLCALFGGPPRAVTAKDSLADTVKAQWPKDTLTVRLRQSLTYCGDVIATLTDASLADTLPVESTLSSTSV